MMHVTRLIIVRTTGTWRSEGKVLCLSTNQPTWYRRTYNVLAETVPRVLVGLRMVVNGSPLSLIDTYVSERRGPPTMGASCEVKRRDIDVGFIFVGPSPWDVPSSESSWA